MDITAVLNLHNEGALAHSSLLSMLRAREACRNEGLRVEILLCLDRPDEATRSYAAGLAEPDLRILETQGGDLGLARNAAVSTARGDFVAFLDGDDLWSDNWLAGAHAAARGSPAETIWHPEASLYFGARPPYWLLHQDMDIRGWDWETLALRNHWTALSFAARAIYLRVPYRPSDPGRQLGYEDWCWNMDVIAAGCMHRIVAGTAHLVRTREASLVQRAAAAGSLPLPSPLFRRGLRRAE
jgi:glycosyltransferase involved in cell wall biosynthesis